MFSFNITDNLPNAVKHTYRFHLMAAPFHGVLFALIGGNSYIALNVFGASEFQVALIKMSWIGSMIFSIYWGHLAVRQPKTRLLFWTLFTSSVGFGLIGLLPHSLSLSFAPGINSAFVFTSCSVLATASLSLLPVALNSICRSNYPTSHRNRIVASIWAVLFLSSALFAGLTGLALDRWTGAYHVIYPLVAVAGITSAFIYRRIIVRGERLYLRQVHAARGSLFSLESITAPLRQSARILRQDRHFRHFMIGYFIFGFANLMGMPLYDLYYKHELELSNLKALTALKIVPSVLIVVTIGFWGRMIDKQNIFRSRAFFSLLWIAEPVCYIIGNSFGWVLGAKVVVGIAYSGGQLLWNIGILEFASRERAPFYVGIHTTLVGLRGLTAPFVGVFLYSRLGLSFNTMFSLVIVLMTVSIIYLLVTGASYRRPSSGKI